MSFGPGSLMGRERTLMVWEMFKIYGGRIQAVEAFMNTAPLALDSAGTCNSER
jgi:hypothetical protein